MASGEEEIPTSTPESTPQGISESSSTTNNYGQRNTVSNAKFEVEKFDGTNNFGMWQCEVLDVLYQQELDMTLEKWPDDISDKDWLKLNRQACGTIRLCLTKDQKYFVMKETIAKELREKLENKYVTKSVENRLYLKKKLYRFQYSQEEGQDDSPRPVSISIDHQRQD
jgi:hypothetical protein